MAAAARVSYRVGQLADIAGVSVRALHHYDEIGLLAPSDRTAAGYRCYSEADLERLQQILLYRECGFTLEEVGALLDDPEADAVAHLRRQHQALNQRMARLRRMLAAVENLMEAHVMDIGLTPEERFEVFGDFRPDDHAEEVERRWGETDAYRQSQRRVSAYTKEGWQQVKDGAADIDEQFASALREGAAPESVRAMELAERHRQHISRWFYECGHDMHRGLADMYVADERFAQRYDRLERGLAAYVRAAVHANADRAGGT